MLETYIILLTSVSPINLIKRGKKESDPSSQLPLLLAGSSHYHLTTVLLQLPSNWSPWVCACAPPVQSQRSGQRDHFKSYHATSLAEFFYSFPYLIISSYVGLSGPSTTSLSHALLFPPPYFHCTTLPSCLAVHFTVRPAPFRGLCSRHSFCQANPPELCLAGHLLEVSAQMSPSQ